MGYQALRDRGKRTETDSDQSGESDGPQRWPSRADVGPTTVGPTTKEDIEEYYGREISSVDELQELQRLEKGYGGQVLRWIDEGMPIAAMGHKTKMQRFRDRKGTPIPWDIEHFNRLSRMDNTGKVNRDRRRGPDGDAGVPDSVREVISSPGRPLDTSIQRAVEERMGDSLGDVRIHTGPKAAAAAEQINARAFTVGNHVAFGAGEYDPESAEGQHVLAHELAHVRQQTDGVARLPTGEQVSDPGPDASANLDTGDSVALLLQRRKYEEYRELLEARESATEEIDAAPDENLAHPAEVTGDEQLEIGEISDERDPTADGVHRDVFEAAYPELYDVEELEENLVGNVHHAIEQQIIQPGGRPFFPGLLSPREMHSVENLRGIPNDVQAELHQSVIRVEWNRVYRDAELRKLERKWSRAYRRHVSDDPEELSPREAASRVESPEVPEEVKRLRREIREYLLERVEELDRELGHHFLPEMYTEGSESD
ncbi:DUF4157 domain-containing protein [Halobaculum sp. MBLA0147]|uniref:eCIS core domain-containing protein n=1 Tax=Halobaculum sp. MBLA0147 TaxID=3079934 RepID=UPI0035255C88